LIKVALEEITEEEVKNYQHLAALSSDIDNLINGALNDKDLPTIYTTAKKIDVDDGHSLEFEVYMWQKVISPYMGLLQIPYRIGLKPSNGLIAIELHDTPKNNNEPSLVRYSSQVSTQLSLEDLAQQEIIIGYLHPLEGSQQIASIVLLTSELNNKGQILRLVDKVEMPITQTPAIEHIVQAPVEDLDAGYAEGQGADIPLHDLLVKKASEYSFIHPDYILTVNNASKVLGVYRTTIYYFKKKHPEFFNEDGSITLENLVSLAIANVEYNKKIGIGVKLNRMSDYLENIAKYDRNLRDADDISLSQPTPKDMEGYKPPYELTEEQLNTLVTAGQVGIAYFKNKRPINQAQFVSKYSSIFTKQGTSKVASLADIIKASEQDPEISYEMIDTLVQIVLGINLHHLLLLK